MAYAILCPKYLPCLRTPRSRALSPGCERVLCISRAHACEGVTGGYLTPSTTNPESSARISQSFKTSRSVTFVVHANTEYTFTYVYGIFCWPAFYSVSFHIPRTFLRSKLFSMVSLLAVRQSINYYLFVRFT